MSYVVRYHTYSPAHVFVVGGYCVQQYVVLMFTAVRCEIGKHLAQGGTQSFYHAVRLGMVRAGVYLFTDPDILQTPRHTTDISS